MADDNKTNPIEIQKHLKGMDYPADKQDLVEHAREQGAPEDILSTLEALPEQQYETPTDVTKAVGEME
jgi:hypothetical protein